MKLTQIWVALFGTAEWLGFDIGFWVSLAAIATVVIAMNVVFWSVKPLSENEQGSSEAEG